MGMLFARRKKNNVEGVTTTNNLLLKEPKKVENAITPKVKSVSTNTQKQTVAQPSATQPKFKV